MSLSDCALHSLSRLKWYHIFSWSVGLVMALLLSTVKGINGFWYVDEDVDTTAICWIKSSQSQGSVVNWRTFLFLYVPLVVVYVYCCRVLSGAYSHLRKGISKTFQHRVRVLVMNSINIGIYMTYWAVLGVLYAFAYAFSGSDEVVSRWFWRLVMFIISSKGFADLLVFILVSEASVLPGSGDGGGDSESMDVNGAGAALLHHWHQRVRRAQGGLASEEKTCAADDTEEHSAAEHSDSAASPAPRL
jgi:hypothetical protein